MQKKFSPIVLPIILALLLSTVVSCGTFQEPEAIDPVSIIYATDMHYLSPEYLGDGSYFSSMGTYNDGKVTHYSNELFDAFLAEVIQKKPEVLVLSGDLTLNGSVKSHTEFVEKLKTVQQAGIDVLVIPGNHDVDQVAGDYSGETPVVVEALTSDGFMELYENFGPAQAMSRDGYTFSYIYEVSPELRILMVDTNCYAQCYVKEETLTWIEEELQKAKEDGADVISVTHQNLYAHNPLLFFGYQLYNADDLLALYEEYDVAINLSGHIHIQSIVPEPVAEVSTASLSISPTQYGLLTYDGNTLEYEAQQTDVDAYAANNNMDNEDLLNYAEYSRYYFQEIARRRTRESYADKELTEEELNLLVETYVTINSNYFEGKSLDLDALAEGIALWRTQEEDFHLRYIETMLEETKTNNLNITIELD